MNKFEFDRKVAFATDNSIDEVSTITELFLNLVAEEIAKGSDVRLRCLGRFKLSVQGGPPANKRFGIMKTGQTLQYRVNFSKSTTIKRLLKRRLEKANVHRQIRRI